MHVVLLGKLPHRMATSLASEAFSYHTMRGSATNYKWISRLLDFFSLLSDSTSSLS